MPIPTRPIPRDLAEKLMREMLESGEVVKEGGHWPYRGKGVRKGVPTKFISQGGQTIALSIPRLSYVAFAGDIDGKNIHHRCTWPNCVNPEHLDVLCSKAVRRVTSEVNHLRDSKCERDGHSWNGGGFCVNCKKKRWL